MKTIVMRHARCRVAVGRQAYPTRHATWYLVLVLAIGGALSPACSNPVGRAPEAEVPTSVTTETPAEVVPSEVSGVTRVDLAAIPDLQATCYDDGDACPGGCDPHVVANPQTNGTARLHAPGSSAPHWAKCRNGAACEVCFGDEPVPGCLDVTFRGSGPDPGRADFTASWWASTCQGDDLPTTLASECRRIRSGAGLLEGKVSCLANPAAPGCAGVAPVAETVAAARAEVRACLESTNGSWRCHYKGPNGTLSPGSCTNGAVNASGWDCCNGDPVHDACVTGCSRYYR